MRTSMLATSTVALLAIGAGGIVFAQSVPDPGAVTVQVTEGVRAKPPSGWSVIPSQDSNPFIEMVYKHPPAEASGKVGVTIDAHATITTENRRSHAEAVNRLVEIAAEVNAPPRFFTVDGWPALQRRYRAPLERTGEDKVEKSFSRTSSLSLHTTTAIAAGAKIIRIEGAVAPEAPDDLADQIEQMAQGIGIDAKADPAQTEREVRELKAIPPPEPSTAPPPSLGQAPAPQERSPETERTAALGTVWVHQGLGELEIAVSPNGQNVVVAANSGFSNSTDGGATFTYRGGTPGTFPRDGDPSVGWGPSNNGSFYYAFIGFPNGFPPETGDGCASSVAVSLNNGQTFNWVGNATLCPRNGPNFCFPDQEHLAVDRLNMGFGGDQVYVVWRNFVPNGTVISCDQIGSGFPTARISCSADGGRTWPLQSATVGGGDFPRVTVGSDGFVYVVYLSRGNVMLDKFSPCAAGLIRETGFPVSVAAAVAGLPCPVPGLDRCNDGNTLASPMVAVDDTNPLHVFVSFAIPAGSGGDAVVVHDSLDGGATWPGVAQVSSPVVARRFLPWLCAANGGAQVSWYDRRVATPGSNDLTGYFYGSVRRSGGRLLPLGERYVSRVADAQCASGWPCGTRAAADAESCSVQPQLAGMCTGGGPCDFNPPSCPAGETCQTNSGCPKYGDYNGNACAHGIVYTAWASATPPPEVVAPPGLNIFANVSPALGSTPTGTDYCRRVGDENLKSSYVSCTASAGTAFGPTYMSGVIDWGYDAGAAWVDFNGDAKADYCRRVGSENHKSSYVSCTVSTGTGFGPTYTSGVIDWGYDAGAAWVDFNGDAKADYCRRVGNENLKSSFVSCTVSTGTGFGPTFRSGVIDWGYDAGAAWVDFNADGRADYCRRVGDENQKSSFVSCTASTGAGFGPTFTSGVIDWGYDPGVGWADFNGDGRADYCRRVGDTAAQQISCTTSTGTGFGSTFFSGPIDWGYDAGLGWADFNADGKADYCRRVGDTASQQISCTTSTGTGFGPMFFSGPIDWGYDVGVAWTDVDGDGQADYCRRVGDENLVTSYVSCTRSAGTGFGATFLSGVIDWGYDAGVDWADSVVP